jgi:MFS family permease
MRSNVLKSLKEISHWERRFLVATLCFYAAEYYLINPMIPTLVENMGIEKQTGWVTGFFFLGAILAIFVSGSLLDRFGSWVVSWMMVSCTAITIACFSFVVVDLRSLLATQLVRGLLYGIQLASADAMLTQMVAREKRAEAFGRMYSTSTISLLIFSKSGIDLAERDHYLWLWVLGVVLAIASAFFFLLNRIPRVERQAGEPPIRKRVVYTGVIPSGMAVMGVTLFCGVVFQYIQKYSMEAGYFGSAGYFTATMAISVLVFRHIVLEKFPERVDLIVTVSIILLMVSGCLLATKGMVPYFAASILVGVGFGICVPFFAACAYAHVPEEKRSQAAATYSTMVNMGPLLGLVAGGFLGEIIGYRMMYLVMTPFLMVTLGFWVAIWLRRRVAAE